MSAATDQDFQTLKRNLDSLKGDVSDLTRAVKDLVKDESRGAAGHVKDAAGQVKNAGQHAGRTIKEHPKSSAGTAVGLGIIIGLLIYRQMRD
jgi:ElaB/YqjD/DUF883 family membrane-anchored ribosome-binding protein